MVVVRRAVVAVSEWVAVCTRCRSMKVQSSLMGVGGWYECLAAGWLADMRSKQVPTSTTTARRLAALSKLLFLLRLFAVYFIIHFIFMFIVSSYFFHFMFSTSKFYRSILNYQLIYLKLSYYLK